MKKTVITIISIYMAANMTSFGQTENQNTMNQKLLENALCLLSENNYSLTYLYSVSRIQEHEYNTEQQEKLIGNGDYFLIYHSESKSKDTNNSRGDYYTKILHIIPENNDRYRMEVQTTNRGKYINIEFQTIDHEFNIELTYEWRFAGYSDDMDSEEAKVLKFYKDISQILLQPDYLDSLCLAMSKECRAAIVNNIDDNACNLTVNHWFTKYLYWTTYDTTGTPRMNISEKRLKEGVLLRITEGKFRIEEKDGRGKTYNCPTEMSETEYFFLNNELIKISIVKGYTDYNAIPSNYWIGIRQLDLLCQESKIVKRKAYSYFGDIIPYKPLEEELVELYIKDFDINEEALIQKARKLYLYEK
jgi:hypothetical protein